MKTLVWCLTICIAALDQLTKFLVVRYIDPSHSVRVIRGILYLTLVRNTGAAFGIFKNQTLFFVIVSCVTIAFVMVYLRKQSSGHATNNIGLALILGGALGNLFDRVRLGYVIDFLDFRVWPVFNIADSALTIGVILIIISIVLKRQTKAQ